MAKIAGIANKTNAKGEITHVTVSVKQHREKLMQMGLLEKSQFEKECEKGITVEEARQQTLEFLKTLPWKK